MVSINGSDWSPAKGSIIRLTAMCFASVDIFYKIFLLNNIEECKCMNLVDNFFLAQAVLE